MIDILQVFIFSDSLPPPVLELISPDLAILISTLPPPGNLDTPTSSLDVEKLKRLIAPYKPLAPALEWSTSTGTSFSDVFPLEVLTSALPRRDVAGSAIRIALRSRRQSLSRLVRPPQPLPHVSPRPSRLLLPLRLPPRLPDPPPLLPCRYHARIGTFRRRPPPPPPNRARRFCHPRLRSVLPTNG